MISSDYYFIDYQTWLATAARSVWEEQIDEYTKPIETWQFNDLMGEPHTLGDVLNSLVSMMAPIVVAACGDPTSPQCLCAALVVMPERDKDNKITEAIMAEWEWADLFIEHKANGDADVTGLEAMMSAALACMLTEYGLRELTAIGEGQ